MRDPQRRGTAITATTQNVGHDAVAGVDQAILRLETRVNLAEHAAAADLAEDVDDFLAAVMAELESWDVYLERLQVRVATTAGDGRGEAERAIAELRGYRNTAAAHLRGLTSTPGEAWREVREQIRPVRTELESRAATVEATLAEGSTR
jgi:hypothetical protein